MNAIYVAIILVQVGVIIYFVRRGRLQSEKSLEQTTAPVETSFEGLRQLALNVTPAQLKLAIPDTQKLVYGVVMDWNTGEMVVTLSTYITGAANLYMSNGGGVSGGGKNPNVGEAAVRLVTTAQDFVERALPVGTKELPPAGCVRFYLLTNKQTFAAQEMVRFFDDQSSPWLALFEKANEVIAEMKDDL